MTKSWFLCSTKPGGAYNVIRTAMSNRHKLTQQGFSETMRLDGEQSIIKVAGVDDDWRDFLSNLPEAATQIITVYDEITHDDIFDYLYTEEWTESEPEPVFNAGLRVQ